MNDGPAVPDGYLRALGLPAAPATREHLDRLIAAHVATYPFGSVAVRLGDDLPLDLADVYDRIVVRRRGGYCFEHNLLMFEVLQSSGFDVTMCLGRVLTSGNPHPPLTHRVSIVDLDGQRLLVDVGFGPRGPGVAVPFDGTAVGPAWRRVRMLATGPDEWTVLAGADGDEGPLYRFREGEYGSSDCELGHFYSHRHPSSDFVRRLIASTLLPGETRSLLDREYRVIDASGTRRQDVDGVEALHDLLTGQFGLAVDLEECRRLLPASAVP